MQHDIEAWPSTTPIQIQGRRVTLPPRLVLHARIRAARVALLLLIWGRVLAVYGMLCSFLVAVEVLDGEEKVCCVEAANYSAKVGEVRHR